MHACAFVTYARTFASIHAYVRTVCGCVNVCMCTHVDVCGCVWLYVACTHVLIRRELSDFADEVLLMFVQNQGRGHRQRERKRERESF